MTDTEVEAIRERIRTRYNGTDVEQEAIDVRTLLDSYDALKEDYLDVCAAGRDLFAWAGRDTPPGVLNAWRKAGR